VESDGEATARHWEVTKENGMEELVDNVVQQEGDGPREACSLWKEEVSPP
jgi:hypothetical protein